MMRILIADDHAVVRLGLKQMLSESFKGVVVDEAVDGRQALKKIATAVYEMVLMDISMPGPSGLEVLKQIKGEYPRLPVLILSMHPEEQYAVRALRAGAAGYLTKESAPEELIAAVNKVLRGGKYITASLAERLASELEPEGEKPLHRNLSDREYEVMCMIARGKRLKEIGRELGLSEKTVSTYRSRILEKMKLESNAAIAQYAIRNGLID